MWARRNPYLGLVVKAFSTSDLLSDEHACPAFSCPLISKTNKPPAQSVHAFQAQHGPENRFHNRMSPSERSCPTFYEIKKTPPSTSWAFKVHRRPENRSRYIYCSSQGSEGAYRWVALIVLLSFGAGFLLADIVLRII